MLLLVLDYSRNIYRERDVYVCVCMVWYIQRKWSIHNNMGVVYVELGGIGLESVGHIRQGREKKFPNYKKKKKKNGYTKEKKEKQLSSRRETPTPTTQGRK